MSIHMTLAYLLVAFCSIIDVDSNNAFRISETNQKLLQVQTNLEQPGQTEMILAQLDRIQKQVEQDKIEREHIQKQLENTQVQLEETKIQSEKTQAQSEKTQAQSEKTQAQLEETQAQSEKTQAQLEKTQAQLEKEKIEAQLHREKMQALLDQREEKSQLNAGAASFTVDCPYDATYNGGQRIPFPQVHLNRGNYYDTTSSSFTCPVLGMYLFSVDLCIRDEAHVHIVKFSGGVAQIIASTDCCCGFSGIQCGQTVVAECQAGDSVYVEAYGNTQIQTQTDHKQSLFTGYLINQL